MHDLRNEEVKMKEEDGRRKGGEEEKAMGKEKKGGENWGSGSKLDDCI